MATWEEVLSTLEAELNQQEEALRTGNVRPVPAFVEPTDLGELPAYLKDRAAHLTSRIRLLATFVQYQLMATDADLRHANRVPSTTRAMALFFDASA